jgi:hypothetical protein
MAEEDDGLPDPRDRQASEIWLAKQPCEWAVTIAARAALRVLPAIRGSDDASTIILPVIRATAIARFVAKYPDRAIAAAAAARAAADAASEAAEVIVASPAARAARAATAASFTAAYAAHDVEAAAAYAADTAAYASAYAGAITATTHDAQQLFSGQETPGRLAAAPLWQSLPPAPIGGAWLGLTQELRARGDHWSIWTDWYDDVSTGVAASEQEDAAFTDIPSELPWDDGAEAVNTEIVRRLEEIRRSKTEIPNPSPASFHASERGRPPDPQDRFAFRNWLATGPTEWSVTIAARAALRLVPALQGEQNVTRNVLPVLGANAIARFVVAKYLKRTNPNTFTGAVPGLAQASPTSASAIAAVTAARGAEASAVSAAAGAPVITVHAAAITATDPSAGGRVPSLPPTMATAAFAAIKYDAQRLYEGAVTAERLARDPLWPNSTPAEFLEVWRLLRAELLALGRHWIVWTDWYEYVAFHPPEAYRGVSEAQDAAFTDIPGRLPWDKGAEAVNTEIARRLAEIARPASPRMQDIANPIVIDQQTSPDPIPVEDVPSPIGLDQGADGRIWADAGKFASPIIPPPLTLEDHARALAACRIRAQQLRKAASSPEFQGRREYAEALSSYLDWLPAKPDEGNILLADGEARVLNKLFSAEESVLAVGFASGLSVFLEDHIALRAFYPELERHYHAVRTMRIIVPLSRDAVDAIRAVIHAQTPSVFHESVSSSIDEVAKPIPEAKPPSSEDAPPISPGQPKSPKDPVEKADPQQSRSYIIASALNRLWGILKSGKDGSQIIEGWQKTYEQIRPHIGTIMDWLRDNWPSGGFGNP